MSCQYSSMYLGPDTTNLWNCMGIEYFSTYSKPVFFSQKLKIKKESLHKTLPFIFIIFSFSCIINFVSYHFNIITIAVNCPTQWQ